MKKVLLFFALLAVVNVYFAQTTKGSFLIGFHNYSPGPIASDLAGINLFAQTNGLGISFGSSKEKYDGELEEGSQHSTVIGLSLNTLYFVENQFAIGLVGSFSTASVTDKYPGTDDDKSSGTIFLVGPELRYYFDTGEKTKLWLKGGAAIGSISSKYNGESFDPLQLTQFGGGAGVSVFPVSSVSIDFGLGYHMLTITEDDSFGEYKTINGSLAFDIGFGFFFGQNTTPKAVVN